jgi:hypothetical protein
MSDVERETYLHAVRAEAWAAILAAKGDPGQVFAAAAEVYERELRDAIEGRVEAEKGHASIFSGAFDARIVAYEMLDQLSSPCPEREDVQRIIAELDKVIGPDFVREADPTGKVLKSLPYEQRKQMLDALDMVQQVVDERGGKQPPLILIVEDEVGPLMEAAAMRKRGVHVVTERDAMAEPVNLRPFTRDEVAERLSDYLTQLGIDPDEIFEGDPRTTAQILADVALAADGSMAVEVGSPEHRVAERVHVAEMSAQDIARGES